MSDKLKFRKPGCILFPFSILYGMIITVRNFLFNIHILTSKEFSIPILCIGNITVGGTGKTPMVEYLIRVLKKDFQIGILSRGYKRKSKGFRLVETNSKVEEVGDEPLQIKQKFPEITVAVEKKRPEGVKLVLQHNKDIKAMLLDDAFQHRYIKAGVNIVILDYTRPVYKDYLLPYGNLREHRHELRRANMVIVNKTPEHFKPIEKRILIKELNLMAYQFLFFTRLKYGKLKPVYPRAAKQVDLEHMRSLKSSIILLTGIGNPEPLKNKLKEITSDMHMMTFPDHHAYSMQDIEDVLEKFQAINSSHKSIITTEKDAVRLRELPIEKEYKKYFLYLPVELEFLEGKEKLFNSMMFDYVKTNRNISKLRK